MSKKTQQLQIRVSPEEKAAIRRRAERAGQDLSTYVLARALPRERGRFAEILRGLEAEGSHREGQHRYWLAELNDLLAGLGPMEFEAELEDAVADADLDRLSPFLANYVAAMVEQAAHQKRVRAPGWTRRVEPLEEPYFAAPFPRLRPYLLRVPPVPFKRRNLFVDAGVGDRV